VNPLRAGIVVLAALVLAGCGGGAGSSAEDGTTTENDSVTIAAPEWAVPALSKPGPEGAAIMAGSDWAVGENRVSFLLVREDGSVVRAPRADVSYAPAADEPVRTAVAELVSIGVDESADSDEVREIYVVDLDLPRAEKTWMVVEPRGVAFQGFQILDVKAEPEAVAIGAKAPASDNPTLDDAPAKRITTSRPPDVALLRHSVADSLAAGVPFVVAFATPAYCESRTCGPTIDVVEAVRERFEREGVRFIHVEIYEDNQPGQGVNRWVTEWRLPTEPWVFVVDHDGVVRDRFEGAVSVDELTGSVRDNLLS
jgi:hypothetical protein